MFSPSKIQEHITAPNRSAQSWSKNKNGLTFQKLGSPKASLAQFLDSFMVWELTTSWKSSEGVGWETQATRLLHSPDYSLKACSDLQHLNQGPQRSKLPGRLLAVSEFWKRKYWNSCTDAQTFLHHLVKLICNALYRNKARSVASRKQSSNSKEEKKHPVHLGTLEMFFKWHYLHSKISSYSEMTVHLPSYIIHVKACFF